jgi:hypothetical protein
MHLNIQISCQFRVAADLVPLECAGSPAAAADLIATSDAVWATAGLSGAIDIQQLSTSVCVRLTAFVHLLLQVGHHHDGPKQGACREL